MTYERFLALDSAEISALPAALAALALDRVGQWDAAHARAAEAKALETDRVHAYLHRKEGDMSNARYWYERVGEPISDLSLEEEWSALVRRFL